MTGTRIGRHFAFGIRREWPAVTLSDSQMRKLLCGKRNLGIWVGDRLVVVDYRGKMKTCPNHAKRNMRKVVK
ncbi:MAG: hypothetical protein PVI03_01255 [Candidatus Thorarchaeota archaeon]|jgi:hypothetical protein